MMKAEEIHMNFRELAAAREDYIIACRRHLHRHPELSDVEENTVAFICGELEKDGIPFVNVPKGGVFAFLGDEARGRTVLLREDIDALPIRESRTNGGGREKQVLSETDGVAHMCGHDCHTAILLGAARALKEIEASLNGRVVLMFERGEENSNNLFYLLRWIDENRLHIDSSFGLHVDPNYETGTICVQPENVNAGFIRFDVKIIGKSAHGSAPYLGHSPVDCYHAVYDGIQGLRMKYANPFDPMTFSIGTIHAGSAYNIVPGELSFSGSFRHFNFPDSRHLKEKMIELIDKTCEIYDCRAEYTIVGPTLPLKNDPVCSGYTTQIFRRDLGPDVPVSGQASMGSESHALTSKLYPGVYVRLGVRSEAAGMTAPTHNECFEPDENALALGCAAHLCYAVNFLKDGPDTSDRVFTGSIKDAFALYREEALNIYND